MTVEILRLLASKEEQRQYQSEVPIANVPAELVCMWFDDHYYPDTKWFKESFDDRELSTLAEFNAYYDQRVEKLPKALDELLNSSVWNEVVKKASETLTAIRGECADD